MSIITHRAAPSRDSENPNVLMMLYLSGCWCVRVCWGSSPCKYSDSLHVCFKGTHLPCFLFSIFRFFLTVGFIPYNGLVKDFLPNCKQFITNRQYSFPQIELPMLCFLMDFSLNKICNCWMQKDSRPLQSQGIPQFSKTSFKSLFAFLNLKYEITMWEIVRLSLKFLPATFQINFITSNMDII